MGIALALKRLGRVYRFSPRQYVRINYMFIAGYTIGVITGLHLGAHLGWDWERASNFDLIALAVLVLLRWWSDRDPAQTAPSHI
jgi:hypothetical protein